MKTFKEVIFNVVLMKLQSRDLKSARWWSDFGFYLQSFSEEARFFIVLQEIITLRDCESLCFETLDSLVSVAELVAIDKPAVVDENASKDGDSAELKASVNPCVRTNEEECVEPEKPEPSRKQIFIDAITKFQTDHNLSLASVARILDESYSQLHKICHGKKTCNVTERVSARVFASIREVENNPSLLSSEKVEKLSRNNPRAIHNLLMEFKQRHGLNNDQVLKIVGISAETLRRLTLKNNGSIQKKTYHRILRRIKAYGKSHQEVFCKNPEPVEVHRESEVEVLEVNVPEVNVSSVL